MLLKSYIQKAEKLAGTIWQPRKIGGKSKEILSTKFCDKRALVIKINEFCDKIAYLLTNYDICVYLSKI